VTDWLGEEQPPDRILRAGRRAPEETDAAPVCAPVTADTWRHSATQDDSERGADRHLAMACDTTRHAGWGLHNRRAPVRFLSHLRKNPQFMGAANL
jgi:hypothetical protein